ncbi:hypothetical protein [Polyangium sp. 15x6]|uniref:hypothetical protein n=1 Tax=Polyangium sp. 15x6 TaxID=3042687 RepID=UPI00249B953A|nr:hypothetical protein [Polyangium sp. 15x6]MDI3291894.1 hypothetical protein [Polyangium sp. 15x6]
MPKGEKSAPEVWLRHRGLAAFTNAIEFGERQPIDITITEEDRAARLSVTAPAVNAP